MKRIAKPFLCVLLLLLPGLFLWPGDFGLVLDQSAGVGGYGKDAGFDYSGMLVPRFSALLGASGGFSVSAGLMAEYAHKTWSFVPELLRTEFVWSFDSGDFTAGRMRYSDPLGFIADGLFDGMKFSLDTNGGTFSAGAWYTGLLYKNRANITMKEDEQLANLKRLDYSDFYHTYFAPRRIITALEWENPSLAELVKINAAFLAQTDLSRENGLYSQYLALKLALPYRAFVFSLGGCLEFIQASGQKSRAALAGELGVGWEVPGRLEDQLSFLGRFSSGVGKGGSLIAFVPITTSTQGELLRAKLSGLSVISLDYIARIRETFSAGLSSSYFIRSDLGTFDYGADGYLVGNEFFARFLWSPVSDIQLNLGGGVFLPSMGNAARKADSLWRVELNVIIALY